MKPAAFLEIRSFVGTSAIGATHYYAKVKWNEDPADRYKTAEHEVTKRMTAKEARALNKKDDDMPGGAHYKPGDSTYRFDTREEAVRLGVAWASANLPDRLLILGGWGNRSAVPIAWAPPGTDAALVARVNALAAEWERIDGYEGDEKRADAIDDEWQALLKPWFE